MVFQKKDTLFLFALILAILIFLLEVVILILYRETWFDELNYLWKSSLIMKGEIVPFKDVILEYPPLFVPIYGFFQVLFGPSFYLGRLISSLFFGALLFFVFLIGKKIGSKWWGLAAVFLILSNLLLVGNYVSATLYSLAAFLLIIVFWIETLQISRLRKIIFSAIVFGLLILIRINMLPAVILYVVYLFLIPFFAKSDTKGMAIKIIKNNLKDIVLFLVIFGGVVVLGYLPIILSDPELSLSYILYPFYSFGPMKDLPLSAVVGGQKLSEFFTVLIDFLKEYYSFLLLFFSVVFYLILENIGNIREFIKKETLCLLLFCLSLGLIISHYFYWRIIGNVYYANYFMPLVVLSIICGISRFLSNNRGVITIFILVILLNFSVNLFRTDILSDPREESDFQRISRGARLLIEKTKKEDNIIAFDNSIFHIFAADRKTFTPLMNRDFLYIHDFETDKAKRLKFYNFEILKDWLLLKGDFVVLHKERWNLSFFRGSFWGRTADEGAYQKIEQIQKILNDNYELVGVALNVYPRKYTQGNDGGTLELYQRKK